VASRHHRNRTDAEGMSRLDQVVEGARAERGFPFERRLPPPADAAAARATLRLFLGLPLHASQNHTPSGATSSPIHPKWNYVTRIRSAYTIAITQ
jgi:hypothetical protein